MEQYTSTVPQLHGRLDPVSYGSYLDAAIPFPRTSGAKFCACGEWWESNFRMTLLPVSVICFISRWMKRSKHGLFVFPPKKTLLWRRHCSIGQSLLQFDVKAKSHARLCPFAKPIKSFYFRSFVVSALFARFHFKVMRKSLWHSIITLSLSPLIC